MLEIKKTFRKIKDSFVIFRKKNADSSYNRLMTAICQIKLQNYEAAQRNCLIALENCSFRKEPGYRIFLATSQIEKLPELYILAGQPQTFLPTLITEVEAYKTDRRGNSLVAHYAYALMAFLLGEEEKAVLHHDPLTKYSKVKDMFAIGELVQAIGNRDQPLFDQSIDHLLAAHRGMAKFGGLRETPEGYLSLAAMCLVKLASDRGLLIQAESEYLSLQYLDYLDEHFG